MVLFLFFLFPALYTFWLSFYKFSTLSDPLFVGFANYRAVFSDPLFVQSFLRSFLYLFGVVPPLVILPIFLAVLVEKPIRGIPFFRASYYLPVVISMVVVGIMWRWLYEEQGILNHLLGIMGISPVNWLSDPHVALFAIMTVTVWKGLGYYMVIYLAGLQQIPVQLYESARLEGAGHLTQHWHITFPLLKPYMVLVTLISSISALKVFTEIYVMTRGGPLKGTQTVVYYIYEEAFEKLHFGYASAMGVLFFLVVGGVSLLYLYLMERQGEV